MSESSEPAAPNAESATGQNMTASNAEWAKLRSRIERLEQELTDVRCLLRKVEAGRAEAEAERDQYRRAFLDQLRANFSEAELRALAEPENEADCEPLDKFIGELEEVVRRAKRAS